MTLQRFFFTSAAALAVLGASACSSSDGDSTPATDPAPAVSEAATSDSTPADAAGQSGAAAVGISQSRFDPTEITIAVGETVTFTNTDPFAHTVTAKDDSALQFDSGNLGQDATFDVEFAEAGTFNYFCQIHPTMRASVIVG